MSEHDVIGHGTGKTLFVSDLSLGSEVAEVFILSAAQLGQAKNGPYWRLEFRDASGALEGKIWSPQSQAYPDLLPGMAAWLKGRVISYRDKLELAVDTLRVLSEEEKAGLDMACFMPASPHSPESMLEELKGLAVKTLSYKPWRKFILSVLDDAEIGPLLRVAPAAKAIHHAYAGGLLEHTLSVAQLCLRIADQYPSLDRQALFAGAVCHDLGKIWELSFGLSIDYTTSGRLIGHISLLLEKLAPFIKKSGLEPELAEHLQHMILSHHGTHEFGSPRLPATVEAFALHYADNIDAKMQQVTEALSGVDAGGWSAYNTPLERFLFRSPQIPQSPQTMPEASCGVTGAGRVKEASTQPSQPLSLFS